jgi:integrase
MYRVLIDTSVWLDIAGAPKRFVELAIIETMVRRSVLQLIVPRLAIREFHGNRENFAHRAATELVPHAREVRKAALSVGGPKKKITAFLDHLDHLTTDVPLAGGGTHQALDRIERLLLASPVVPQSDAVTKEAVQRGLDKRAPFHDRNGMADAILIETYGQCLKDNADPGIRFAFITSDKGDFSQAGGDKRVPHRDVEQFFRPGKSYFFIDVLRALEHIDAGIVTEVATQDEPTVAVLLKKYAQSSLASKGVKTLLNMISGMPLGAKKISKLKPNDYLDHINLRREKVEPITALQDIIFISSAFKWAQTYLSADVSIETLDRARQSAWKRGLIGKSKASVVRRLSAADEQRILDKCRPLRRREDSINMTNVFLFALWSARRLDEICRIRWEDFEEETGMCKVRDVFKTGRDLPFRIVGKALEAVLRQKETCGGRDRIFPYKRVSVSQKYVLIKKELKIPITFDQIRDEGIRRLLESKEYSLEVISEVVGDAQKVWDIKLELEQDKANEAIGETSQIAGYVAA